MWIKTKDEEYIKTTSNERNDCIFEENFITFALIRVSLI